MEVFNLVAFNKLIHTCTHRRARTHNPVHIHMCAYTHKPDEGLVLKFNEIVHL